MILFFIIISSIRPTIAQPPKWWSGTPTAELVKLCDSETETQKKVRVCTAVVSRYSKMALKSIPAEGKSHALDLLQIYQSNPKDDQYIFGLHDSHTTLGRIALKNGDLKTAKDELLKSIQVPSTPPLQTIGPKMTLAGELLAKGEKQAVLDYLEQAEKIWIYKSAKEKLTEWRKEISSGKMINFAQ